ncbi:carboxymuconolactone decarboxylase family protein [Ketobacter sp. MCCC 1A13808]|uniref:carboxymuconolactone decarboxylase family protein n=1 Tax=Ketobacter sp. MCCC 1A13808 TaxID=2602738 RepID=UPI000F187F03|nr:carboxymuconolactone decarboxylase family protein [Ketobacter sp. MCCC 1A13808]MVF14202.1 carboxymuconolactone decarboxylase family protein [Ketobacter sp. MCCC 1A13808]RLP54109.1 MAG: carboxymuconolactone decarboxylase family protein [Ketobacter sp.]
MFNVDIHTMASVPDHTKKLLESVADSIGFVPNIYAVTAESHHALAGLLAINNMFRDSSFSPEEQQVILMVTSVENGCDYCVSGHTLMSQTLGIQQQIILAIRNQEPIRDPRYHILQRVVVELVCCRGRIDQSTLMNFLEQGYSKAQFFELALGVSVKTFTNYVSNALSLTLDDAFEPYQWHRDCSHASNLN